MAKMESKPVEPKLGERPASPSKAGPVRHRVLRCERCRTYLFDVFLKRCDPGTNASLIITMKCRNKKCRRTNQVSVDLVNEDTKEKRV